LVLSAGFTVVVVPVVVVVLEVEVLVVVVLVVVVDAAVVVLPAGSVVVTGGVQVAGPDGSGGVPLLMAQVTTSGCPGMYVTTYCFASGTPRLLGPSCGFASILS
jgi:hypothetical protein